MKKLLVLLILVVLCGCNNNTSTTSGSGVSFSVSTDSEVVSGDPFSIDVEISNKGDYESKGVLCIDSGFEDKGLWGKYSRDFYKISLNMLEEDSYSYSFPGDASDLGYVFKSGKVVNETSVPFEVVSYFDYGFSADVSACYRPVYMSEADSCSANEVSITKVSASPLKVSAVEEIIDEDGIILYFTLSNSGSGSVWDLNSISSCDQGNVSSKGVIVFNAYTESGRRGNCEVGTLFNDLTSGSAKVRCKFTDFGSEFYYPNIRVNGKFGYKILKEVSVDLI